MHVFANMRCGTFRATTCIYVCVAQAAVRPLQLLTVVAYGAHVEKQERHVFER